MDKIKYLMNYILEKFNNAIWKRFIFIICLKKLYVKRNIVNENKK